MGLALVRETVSLGTLTLQIYTKWVFNYEAGSAAYLHVNNSNGNSMPLGSNVVCHQYHQYAVVIIPVAAGDGFSETQLSLTKTFQRWST
jgi:hypothetical protein